MRVQVSELFYLVCVFFFFFILQFGSLFYKNRSTADVNKVVKFMY